MHPGPRSALARLPAFRVGFILPSFRWARGWGGVVRQLTQNRVEPSLIGIFLFAHGQGG